MPFEQVELEDFAEAIAHAPSSDLFRQEYRRHRPMAYDGLNGPDCMIHRGDLKVSGEFRAPGFFTLILGNLTVDGFVNLENPYEKGFDEGGLFVVLGDVSCHALSGEYGKCSFVDGNLRAHDLILNSYSDSALVVTGNLETKFYRGWDIWATVGGAVEMEYGDGYCFPIGYTDPGRQAIYPRKDRDTSLRLLDSGGQDLENHVLIARLRQGNALFNA